jgi:hypothetical protein
VVYYHTRSYADFGLSVKAWVESWATPARMLMGSGKKGSVPATRGSGRPNHGKPDSILNHPWLRESGKRQRIYNLDEMLPLNKPWDPATVQKLKVSMGKALKR